MSRVLLQLADLENTVNRCVQCPNDLAKLKEFLISDVIKSPEAPAPANDTSRLVLGAVAAAAVGMFVQKFFFSK